MARIPIPRRSLFAVLFVAAAALTVQAEAPPFSVESNAGSAHVFVERAMGTEFVWTILPRAGDVGRDDLTPIADAAFAEVAALEDAISTWRPASNASEVNRDGFNRPVALRPAMAELIAFCFETHGATDGAFDITVGPLVEVWRAAKGGEPDAAALEAALPRVGMDKLRFDPDGPTLAFSVEGMRIDFDGVGKGMALDKAAAVMRRYGVKAALLSGGASSMYAIGAPPDTEAWRIAIHNPYDAASPLGVISLRDESLSTSACIHVLDGSTGERPCGIFDPRTGRSVTHMVSVTVAAPMGIETDALSTAFYALGIDGIRRYCESHEGVRAVAVERPDDGVPRPIAIDGNPATEEGEPE